MLYKLAGGLRTSGTATRYPWQPCQRKPPLHATATRHRHNEKSSVEKYFPYPILNKFRLLSASQKRACLSSLIFTLFLFAKTFSKLNMEHSVNLEIYILQIIRHGSLCTDNVQFGHFTLLFCRGRQRNLPRIITHVHSRCIANLAIAVVVSLNFPQ